MRRAVVSASRTAIVNGRPIMSSDSRCRLQRWDFQPIFLRSHRFDSFGDSHSVTCSRRSIFTPPGNSHSSASGSGTQLPLGSRHSTAGMIGEAAARAKAKALAEDLHEPEVEKHAELWNDRLNTIQNTTSNTAGGQQELTPEELRQQLRRDADELDSAALEARVLSAKEPLGDSGTLGSRLLMTAIKQVQNDDAQARDIVKKMRSGDDGGGLASLVAGANVEQISSSTGSKLEGKLKVFDPLEAHTLSHARRETEDSGLMQTRPGALMNSSGGRLSGVSNMADGAGMSNKRRSLAARSIDPDEHFLLADLDPDKDALIFGETREEFYRNVDKTKKIVLRHQRWQIGEKHYRWATWILKFLSFFVVFDNFRTMANKETLANSVDMFRTYIEEVAIHDISHQREKAFERAIEHLHHEPPDFAPIIAAQQKEAEAKRSASDKKKGSHNNGLSRSTKRHPMDTTGHAAALMQEREKRGFGDSGVSPLNIESVRIMRRIVLPQSADWHAVVMEQMHEHRQQKALTARFPRAHQNPSTSTSFPPEKHTQQQTHACSA